MQVVLRTKKSSKGVHSVEVILCRPDTTMEGEEFEGRQCSFPIVMSAVTGTDMEEWE
jgi:hypothetical protein